MSLVSPAHAEEALSHLTHQFAQWRAEPDDPPRAHSQAAVGAGHHARPVLPLRAGRQTIGPHSPGPQTAPRRTTRTPALTPSSHAPPLCGSAVARLAHCPRRKWKSSDLMGRGCGSRIVKPRPPSSRCSRPSWNPANAPTHAPEPHLSRRAARRFPQRNRWAGRAVSPDAERESAGRRGLRLSQPHRDDAQTPGLRWPRLLALHQTPLPGPLPLVAHRRHSRRHALSPAN